jgi:hypothetical protein
MALLVYKVQIVTEDMAMGIAIAHKSPIEEAGSIIPSVFCWTKMGAEAGQSLGDILKRKELERRVGGGVFCWGIGNSLGLAAKAALDSCPDGVEVLFSPMKSAAKPVDVNPAAVSLWLRYVDSRGVYRDLPEHMIITSRRHAPSGVVKETHYALFCKSEVPLSDQSVCCEIDATRAVNYFSQGGLGASQVTAMVRYKPSHTAAALKPYSVLFRANLHDAGFVRLGCPVLLGGELLEVYADLMQAETKRQWKEGARRLKLLAQAAITKCG